MTVHFSWGSLTAVAISPMLSCGSRRRQGSMFSRITVRISVSITLFSLNDSLNVKGSFCVDLLIRTRTRKGSRAGAAASCRNNQKLSHLHDHGYNTASKPEGLFGFCGVFLRRSRSTVATSFGNAFTPIRCVN